MSSDNQEDGPPLAVSALRNKFERLAHDNSPSPITPSKAAAASTSSLIRNHENDLLAPSPTRQRALSSSEVDVDIDACATAHHIRTSSSSSDLKVGRRPPPPPPPRSPKPVGSPVTKPTPAPNSPLSVIDKSSLISRRPPPPPTPVQSINFSEDANEAGGVASLRSKFATKYVHLIVSRLLYDLKI